MRIINSIYLFVNFFRRKNGSSGKWFEEILIYR